MNPSSSKKSFSLLLEMSGLLFLSKGVSNVVVSRDSAPSSWGFRYDRKANGALCDITKSWFFQKQKCLRSVHVTNRPGRCIRAGKYWLKVIPKNLGPLLSAFAPLSAWTSTCQKALEVFWQFSHKEICPQLLLQVDKVLLSEAVDQQRSGWALSVKLLNT